MAPTLTVVVIVYNDDRRRARAVRSVQRQTLTDLEIVVLAIASSVGEELFFRGALMPSIGVWASSGVFALLHIGPRGRYLPWTIGSFVAGLLFSELYRWSGDLSGPVLPHFTVNFLNLRHVAQYELR